MIVKTPTKGLTDSVVGRRDSPVAGPSCAVRLSGAQNQRVRRYWYVLLTFVCGLILAGCVLPKTIPAQGVQSDQSDQSETVEAIQTRIAETRAEQASVKEDAMADTGDRAQDQTTAVEETDAALTTSLTAEQLELLAKLQPRGEAPELFNEVWLNSDPLKLADLRGQVVLVEFWTYG